MAAYLSGLHMNLSEGSTMSGLLERIALVVLITAVSALLFLLVIMQDLQVAREVLKYALLAALGLTAGLSARSLLPSYPFYLRLLSSFLALLVALIALNVASRGFVGLDIQRLNSSAEVQDSALSFGLAAAVSWLTLLAWTRPRAVMVQPRELIEPSVVITNSRPRQADRSPASSSSLVNSFHVWRQRAFTQLARLVPHSTTKVRRRKLTPKVDRPSSRRSRAVQLSTEVENRCPYCLEDVRKNDPRGVKICKVCKTWHHADCWAITGVCQVPHQYVN